MVAVLAQILNFTTMLTIFANAPICYDKMDDKEKQFELWILIEAIVVITTVLANIFFIMVRSCRKVQVDLSLDQVEDVNVPKDFRKDFLASEEN